MTYQFKKIHPSRESTCDIQGEMLLDFMPYGAPHTEEQARKSILSIAVLQGKLLRLDIFFFLVLGTASENKSLYKRGHEMIVKNQSNP